MPQTVMPRFVCECKRLKFLGLPFLDNYEWVFECCALLEYGPTRARIAVEVVFYDSDIRHVALDDVNYTILRVAFTRY